MDPRLVGLSAALEGGGGIPVLRGETTLQEARGAIQQATRRYAKRQLTWFRKEPGVRWFSGFGDDAGVQVSVLEWLQAEGLKQHKLFS